MGLLYHNLPTNISDKHLSVFGVARSLTTLNHEIEHEKNLNCDIY